MHPEPDELAALAADGGEPDATTRAHLRSCPDCRRDYEEFAATVARSRAAAADFDLERPSPSVWGGIHAQLGLSTDLASDPLADADTPRPVAEVRPEPADTGRRRGTRWWWPALAAAAAVVGVVAGITIGTNLVSRTNEAIIAEARLDPLPGWSAEGRALVEEGSDGRRSIVVEMDGEAAPGQVKEVWLLNDDASGLVSLGLLDGKTGRFAVPPDVDLATFSLVDVSSEPTNGDPAHSGDSIVRGQLRAT